MRQPMANDPFLISMDDLAKEFVRDFKKYADELPKNKQKLLDTELDAGEDLIRDSFLKELRRYCPSARKDDLLECASKSAREVIVYGIGLAKNAKLRKT